MNQTQSATHYDVIIIGAGAAGLTAALFLKRSDINCCIIESGAPGGQLLKSSIIENYPGVDRVSGVDLAQTMLKQVVDLGVDYYQAQVLKVSIEGYMKNVITDQGTFTTEKVIIATGRSPKKFGYDKEEELTSRGISYCSVCDGALFKNQSVVVVGSGDSAIESVLFLAPLVKDVTLICRKDTLKAKEKVKDSLKYLDNLKILYNTSVTGFMEENQRLSAIETNQGTVPCNGCFICIGYVPATEPFEDLGILNSEGYIETDKTMQTQVKGIYAIGDTREKKVFQITTAVSDATIAAVSIIRELSQ